MANIRRNSHRAENKVGCGTLSLALALGSAPFLLLTLPKRPAEASKQPDPLPLTQKFVPTLNWIGGESPDQYSPQPQAYKVKAGDTITKIAKSFQVPSDLIATVNNKINGDEHKIKIGDKLIIPAVRNLKVENGGWSGKIFNLDLAQKSSWIYLCQHLLSDKTSGTVREEISCATQYMQSDLRRSFISKISEVMREIASDKIYIPTLDKTENLEVKIRWPDSDATFKSDHRQLAALYSWALDANMQHRFSGRFVDEDTIREINPHPFRISPSALIASTESLRVINHIKVKQFSATEYGLSGANKSIEELTAYPVLTLTDIRSKTPYILINFGVGDYNGAFSNANLIMQASIKPRVPCLYIESYDVVDMLIQSNSVADLAGYKPKTAVLGGHGLIVEKEFRLYVGYDAWSSNEPRGKYYLSSIKHAQHISRLATDCLVILSCKSGAPIKNGKSMVDLVADFVPANKIERPFSIFGLKTPSNLDSIKVREDGTCLPVIGADNQDCYKRTIKPKKNSASPAELL